MAINLTNNILTIDQALTDLSGLSGIAGIDYLAVVQAGNTYYRVVIPANIRVNQTANITLASKYNHLRQDHSGGTFVCWYITNSTLKITDTETKNGVQVWGHRAAVELLHQTISHWNPSEGIVVGAGGKIELDGGALRTNSHINFTTSTSSLKVKNGLIQMSNDSNGNANMLRGAYSNFVVDTDGLTVKDGSNGFESATITNLNNYAPIHQNEGLMLYNSNGTYLTVTINSFNPSGCVKDFAWQVGGATYKVFGFADKAPTASVHYGHFLAAGGGVVEIRKNLEVTILDEQNVAINGSKSYLKDKDNGARVNKVENRLASIEYNAVHNASGVATHNVLCADIQVGANENIGQNSAARTVDYRGKLNSHNYLFDVFISHFGRISKTIVDVSLVGLSNTKSISTNLHDDVNIVEKDKAIVQARPYIRTNVELYEGVQAYLLDNMSLKKESLITPAGDAGAYAIVFDKTATNLVSLSGNIITIKTDTYSGNIKTTSTATTSNGAVVTGVIQDSSGDSQATVSLPTGYDTVTIHATQANADANVSPLFSGTTVRYMAATYGGTTIWLRVSSTTKVGDELIVGQVVPVAAGIHPFIAASFGESAILKAIKLTAEATKTAVEAMSTKVDATKVVVDTTDTKVDATKTVVDATKIVVDADKVVGDATKTAVDATKVVVDTTKTAVDTHGATTTLAKDHAKAANIQTQPVSG